MLFYMGCAVCKRGNSWVMMDGSKVVKKFSNSEFKNVDHFEEIRKYRSEKSIDK